MNSRPPRLRLVVAVLLCALCASPLVAQSAGTGALAGVVTDPTGAVIPNVVVTATHNDTGQSRTVATGADGAYRFNLLPPGTYKVSINGPGFATWRADDVEINVGSAA